MRVNYFIKTLFLFLLVSFNANGQSLETLKYQGYLLRDYTKYQKAIKIIESSSNLSKTESTEELIHFYYLLTSELIAKKKVNDAEINIEKAEDIINALLKKEPNNALALNYKGVFIGYEIALNKSVAIIKGKSCTNYLEKAYQLEPNNPQILFDKGNSLYYSPKLFGGNKKEALKYFQKAISLLEKQNKYHQNWIYLQLLVLEAHSYELLNNDAQAEKIYLKALKTEPNFPLVKNDLYPKLKARMSGASNEKAKEIDYSLDKKK